MMLVKCLLETDFQLCYYGDYKSVFHGSVVHVIPIF